MLGTPLPDCQESLLADNAAKWHQINREFEEGGEGRKRGLCQCPSREG